MKKQERIKELAVKLSQLVEIFRENKPARESEFWIVVTPVTMFKPQYGYEDSQPLYREIIQSILKLNPEMLSENEVHDKIIYYFIIPQIHWDIEPGYLYRQELENHAVEFISELVEFEQWQDIDIAIANLWPDKEQVKIGEVTFLPITKEEIEQWKKGGYVSGSIDDLKVIARVKSPGDMTKALSYARNKVDLVINILRAFCFPFGKKSNMWPVGILGDFNTYRQIPMRINERKYLTMVGPGIHNNRLKEHILTKLTPKQLELIEKLIKNSNRSNMEKKLFDSIHWLAEATKPDTNNAKFAKIGFALETLLGGEPIDEDLKVRGITAMLAERAAFIAGRDKDDRLAIDKDIRTYYGLRSDIVHGGEGEVSLEDIDNFGELVRRAALALLEKLDELGNEIREVNELERWVKKQRYTLPEGSIKVV